jgi:catechol 2,3-dioxygenase-like lactoylglutathione lyase family enzyme
METTATSNLDRAAQTAQPRCSGMSHVSLPCRDLAESKVFYSEVLGGERVHEVAGFVEYRIEDIIIGLAERSDGGTGPDDEYPHYAFFVEAEDFLPMVSRLRQNGVVASEP